MPSSGEGVGLSHFERFNDGMGATALLPAGGCWLRPVAWQSGVARTEMAVSGVFTGAVLAAIDEKGRIAIAASLRNAIPGDPKSRQIYIATHPDSPCLVISGTDRLVRIAADIDRDEELAVRRGEPFNRSAERRRRYGAGEVVACDASGRFIMPPTLHDLGELDQAGSLFLYGVGEFIELWRLDALLALDGDEYADAQRAARSAQRVAGQRK